MIQRIILLTVLVGMVTCQCRPGDNCVLPDCRCANDNSIPGNLSPFETPQVVLVTFQNAIHSANVDNYKDLFTVDNPNGCPARGTFYVQTQFSDLNVISRLYEEGHELGANSFNDSFPAMGGSADDWTQALRSVRENLELILVAPEDIQGVRGPRLMAGGNNEFIGIDNTGYLYDATCATSLYVSKNTLKWPYTYDFVPGPQCDIGTSPTTPFPGKWQVLVADLDFNGTQCATPSACTGVKTQQDAFNLFNISFARHYEGQRSPFMMVINPDWVTVDFKKAGTIQFLEYIRATFEDTWILTVSQALKWIQTPTPNSNITDFEPWKC